MNVSTETTDKKWHICGIHVKYLALAMILIVDVPSSILVHILDDTPIYVRYMIPTVFLVVTFIGGIWLRKDYLLFPNIFHQMYDLSDVPFILWNVLKNIMNGDSSIHDYTFFELFLIIFGLSYYLMMLYASVKCFLYIHSLNEEVSIENKVHITV